jgi:hypothetical protein
MSTHFAGSPTAKDYLESGMEEEKTERRKMAQHTALFFFHLCFIRINQPGNLIRKNGPTTRRRGEKVKGR